MWKGEVIYMFTLIALLIIVGLYVFFAVASLFIVMIILTAVLGILFFVALVRYLSVLNVPTTPTCPYCGNTDIKIEAKCAGTAVGGMFGGGIGVLGTANKYRSLATCSKCGSTFYHIGIQGKKEAENSLMKRGLYFLIALIVLANVSNYLNNSSEQKEVKTSSTNEETVNDEPMVNQNTYGDDASKQIVKYQSNLSSKLDRVTSVIGLSGYGDDESTFEYAEGGLKMDEYNSSVLISALKESHGIEVNEEYLPPLSSGSHVYAFAGYIDNDGVIEDYSNYEWMLSFAGHDDEIQKGIFSYVWLVVNNDDGSISYWKIEDENFNMTLVNIIDYYTKNMAVNMSDFEAGNTSEDVDDTSSDLNLDDDGIAVENLQG